MDADDASAALELQTLETLSADLFSYVASLLPCNALGRLCCVSRVLRSMTLAADEAWEAVWKEETHHAARHLPARDALRSVRTLDDCTWMPFVVGAPRWREHACALTCNGGKRLLLFGGRVGKLYCDDTWTCELLTGAWERVASGERPDDDDAPSPRCYNSDGGGGRVLRSCGEEWAVLFGGLCQPGHRDNQTWLLGPLNAPPTNWRWMRVTPDDMHKPPAARFHHTLTVAPHADDEDDAFDFLVMIGGHDRTISPILDTHFFSLREASFTWASERAPELEGSYENRRIGVEAQWETATPSSDEPDARAFHVAEFWRHPRLGHRCVVMSGGIGEFEDVDEGDGMISSPALGDTWTFDLDDFSDDPEMNTAWTEMDVGEMTPPRSRAASAMARDQLIVCGGCRAGSHIKPGQLLNDVWSLDLLMASDAVGRWTRCTLPADGPARPPHVCASAAALYGGAVLLVLGGHDDVQSGTYHRMAREGLITQDQWPKITSAFDQFGDATGYHAFALHESLVLGTGGSGPAPTLPEPSGCAMPSRLVTAGLPLRCESAEAAGAFAASWFATPGDRVLLHGLQGQPQYNGAVGTIATNAPMQGVADDRVPVKLGAPHCTALQVRRRNLLPSKLGNGPLLVVPPMAHESTTAMWALTPSADLHPSKGASRNLSTSRTIVLHKLSVLPPAGGAEPEEPAADVQ